MNDKKLNPLPPSNDDYWEGAEKQSHTPVKVKICDEHFNEKWVSKSYIDNHDGTVSCKFCPWGTRLPGYIRVYQERIVDLRDLSKG